MSNSIGRWFTDKRLEGIGLILLLLSFGWQTFETDINDLGNESDFYEIHQKLDTIWRIQADYYSRSEANKSGSQFMGNFKHEVRNWQTWSDLKLNKSNIETWSNRVFYIRVSMYVLGSILIIFPKFRQ